MELLDDVRSVNYENLRDNLPRLTKFRCSKLVVEDEGRPLDMVR